MLVLGICCCSLLMASMDNTIVNVALPSIRLAFHASLSGLQWTVDAYTLVLASLLMFSGATADRLGRRRTFQVGLVMFTAGSLLCSAAPALGWLIGARALQAVGGSMLNPVAMSIIANVFPEPRERARAIGVWAAVGGLSMAFGPIVGGALTEGVGWRSIFWINVPIGLLVCALAALFVPESRATAPRRPDPVGQFLVTAALASLTYAIIAGPRHGWRSPEILGLFALSGTALAVLLCYEPRRTDPLLDLRFFRSVPFRNATATAVVAYSALGGFLFLNTIYLQDTRGYSPLEAGLCTLPMALASFLLAPVSGRIVGSRGVRLPLHLAGVCIAGSAGLLSTLSPRTPLPHLLAVYLLFGIGVGMMNSPITTTAVSGMPRAQAGVAAAVASTSRQIGTSLGVAVSGSIAGAAAGRTGAAFAAATHPVWLLTVGYGVAIVVLCTIATTARAEDSARRVAALFGEPVPAGAAPPGSDAPGSGPRRG